MKYHHTLTALGLALMIGLAPAAYAGHDEEATPQAKETEREAQLDAEYREALALTEERQQAAEAALARTKERRQRVAEIEQEADQESQRARATREAELSEMHEELNRARRELQEVSREVARVDREIARERSFGRTGNTFVYQASQRPVIGVILGNNSETGIEVIGVSPDGPAERAGIKKGDILVTMAGHDLGASPGDEADDRLKTAKKALKAGEPIVVTYRRNDKMVDVNVVPEVRDRTHPFGFVHRFKAFVVQYRQGGTNVFKLLFIGGLQAGAVCSFGTQHRRPAGSRLTDVQSGSSTDAAV